MAGARQQTKPHLPAIPLTTAQPISGGALLWKHQGDLWLTLIVKATFKLVPDGPMRLMPRAPALQERDVYERPAASHRVVVPGDIAPKRPLCDVFYAGYAYAKTGLRVGERGVRLALYDGVATLFDKPIHVIGRRSEENARPRSFTRVPVSWELAYGGIGCEDNPLGLGSGESDERLPYLINLDEPQTPTCYCALSQAWPARKRLLGSFDRRTLSGTHTVAFPDDFDWTYFQVAPEDQRVPYLKGGERLVLDGLVPGGERLETGIPRVSVLMREVGTSVLGGLSPFNLDTVYVDGSQERCHLTWRAQTKIHKVTDLDGLGVMLGMKADGKKLWPKAKPLVARLAAADSRGPLFATQQPVSVIQAEPSSRFESTLMSAQTTDDIAAVRKLAAERLGLTAEQLKTGPEAAEGADDAPDTDRDP